MSLNPNNACQRMISHARSTAVMMANGCWPAWNMAPMAAVEARNALELSFARSTPSPGYNR